MGKLYSAVVEEGQLILEEIQHGHYRRVHFSDKRKDTYQIDVITESYLKDYLELIESEMASIWRRLRHWRNQPKVRESINCIVKDAKGSLSEDIRTIFDWDKDNQL
jgi:hypothetical protein